MAGGEVRTIVLTVAIITLLAVGLYMVDPTMCGMVKTTDGFTSSSSSGTLSAAAGGSAPPAPGATSGAQMMGALNQVPSANKAPFTDGPSESPKSAGFKNQEEKPQEGFANLEDITGPADFGSTPTANGCYPRDQLTPGELLPKDGNSTWAQQNPMGTGSLKGKNFLSAGALVGVNTVGQSLRNANQQLRSEPPNPQVPVSVFFNSTIEPDSNRRDMEIS
jgi:hypothetical protein